jgi:predicted RNase H-related nuclease YkuK (DUF458 family)
MSLVKISSELGSHRILFNTNIMEKQFKLEGGEFVDCLVHTREVLSKHPDATIYVGTDSQNKRWNTCYVTVIAYKYNGKGAHYIYFRENVKRIKDRWTRLWKEVENSIVVAKHLEANGLNVTCVELDFNEKEIARSSDMVAAARGYVLGSNFNCNVKPETQCAAKAADHIVRR